MVRVSEKRTVLSAGAVVFRRTERGIRLLLLRAYKNWDFPKGMVESALRHIHILEECNYPEMKVSLKASDPLMMIEAYRELVAVGRQGVADDISGAVAFLASEGAAFVTGQSFAVNGGRTLD